MVTETNHPIASLTIEWRSFEIFTTVEGLARCLLGQWRADCNADAYVTALMVCDAVLSASDEDTGDEARTAFIDAAHEAGLSVYPEDDVI